MAHVGSLDGHELGTSGSTVTDLTVANRLVGHGVFSEVITNHVSLDFDCVPVLSRVDFADGADHLGHDDAVSQVSLDRLWLLTMGSLLDGLSQLLDQTVVTRVDSASESAALARSEHGNNLLCGKFEELVELNASVNLLFEWFSFRCLGSLGSSQFFLDRGHI